jgi:hypothetical protein
MPTVQNQLTYVTSRPSQQPLAPVQLPSTAPLIVSGAPLVFSIFDGANSLALRASHPATDTFTLTIDSLPTLGVLTHATSGAMLQVGSSFNLSWATHALANTTLIVQHVLYTPMGYSAGWFNDTFNYSASERGRPNARATAGAHSSTATPLFPIHYPLRAP